MGLTFDKLLIIGVIAIFLLGPERLPHYASQLARLVRGIRDMANGAKERMREEMGPDFDEVDWKKLDPRQYDPRRIIREALLDDEEHPAGPPARTVLRPPAGVETDAAKRGAGTVAAGAAGAAGVAGVAVGAGAGVSAGAAMSGENSGTVGMSDAAVDAADAAEQGNTFEELTLFDAEAT